MAGFRVVPIKALADGSLDLPDLKEQAEKHKDRLAAFMVRGRLLSPYARLTLPRSPILRLLASSRTVFRKHARSFMQTVVRSTLTVSSFCFTFDLCLIYL